VRLNCLVAIKVMKAIAADPGRRQRFEQYDNLAWLNVKFQDVVPSKSIVHSTKTGEADGAEQTASQEKAEWTCTRMPDLPSAVEKL